MKHKEMINCTCSTYGNMPTGTFTNKICIATFKRDYTFEVFNFKVCIMQQHPTRQKWKFKLEGNENGKKN